MTTIRMWWGGPPGPQPAPWPALLELRVGKWRKPARGLTAAQGGRPTKPLKLCALCALFAVGSFGGEVLDRIAAVVGNTAITESEVIREARIAAFLNGEAPDLTAAGKRRAAERLVEQELVRREISLIRYTDSGQSDAEQAVNQLKSRYASEAQLQQALQQYGITEEDLRSHLAWQASVLRFTEFRFRGGNVDQQLDGWLKEARTRTPVEFREEVFR